ncbi:enhancer of mRNA-decapping protein 3-like [Gymnodraco acuticeps]|uniref:Enhancer of mRNA-decapping protein 3-like n=1 Tax=Gymnodraco acuticeps TaxID=8218 RepID=A0A6P8SU99_GYMAC|nr:enhancer of mRNA-decapping protein 3-like [Gymnodraco acuticeps]
MATDWFESVVSINCGLTLGVYQGSVSSVDHRNQTISLKLPFHNGVRCSLPEVTFSARDIKELKILDFQRTVSEPSSDPGSAAEPSLVPAERQGQPLHHQGTNSTAPITILRREVGGGGLGLQISPGSRY